MEHRLFPAGGSWLDLMPEEAGCTTRLVFACLECRVLEAWQDGHGVIRIYLPESCGGHLVVGGPGEGVEPLRLDVLDRAGSVGCGASVRRESRPSRASAGSA